jgi:squalene-associated FAD-dependent desaturase
MAAAAALGLANQQTRSGATDPSPRLVIDLYEAKRRTGGRAGSFLDGVSLQEIDYCQHVGMGCCTNLLHLLDLAGLLPFFQSTSELVFIEPGVSRSTFRPQPAWPAPLHLAGAFGKMQFLTGLERMLVRRALWALMRLRVSKLLADPSLTMGRWLRSQGQTPRVIERFWNLILASALGEHVDAVALAPARKVFVDGFLRAHGASDLWIPQLPLSNLFGERLPRYLEQLAVNVHQGCRIRGCNQRQDGLFALQFEEESRQPDAYHGLIAAVPWHKLERLLADGNLAAQVPNLAALARLPAAPISGVHLWFNQEVTPLPHAVLVGTLSQWLFRPRPWQEASADGGYYYQVVISASHDLRGRNTADIVSQIVAELQRAFPSERPLTCLRARLVTDPQAVFSISPEVERLRPPPATKLPGFVLAGDFVRTSWPATMEGAVRSGFQAAELLGSQLGIAIHRLQPPQTASWLSRFLIRGESS